MSEETSCPGLGCLPKISDTWRNVSGAFTSTNRVYPSDPVPPKDSEFISVDSKINIRVIHFMPDKARDLFVISPEPSSKRMSISEEYWFTKNKPLRNTSCNCSFRNSFRKSLRNSTKTLTVDVQLNECLEKPSSSISQQKQETLEQFAQGFVEQTLSNALDECTKKTILNNTEGIENPSYEISEVDSAVRLRNQKMNKDSHKVPPDSSLPSLKNCIHKNIKPLIMLLHGLGSTAEVWNTLMHNLALRGFEVIAPDMLGHGFSSAPNKASCYQFKNLVNQFSTVFDYYMKKENQRKCVLIGHSYGCSIITALYPTRATKIAQLILISGGGPTPLAPPADMNEISRYGWAHHLCHPFMYCGLKRSFFYSSRGLFNPWAAVVGR
ncbi:uncharacterized protein LOC126748938 isoform X2 [Anthonomus grandis grandis]|uniref:uncharacterized protein LOC126748938 isoform X2 n=1 Tax=Anthonomus grandis grandis TaxID=2921223 RepID=UPI002165EED5|nr:uncharacterized protein LOC126748938 isoform X2 [Anthonomus grandis grandis]